MLHTALLTLEPGSHCCHQRPTTSYPAQRTAPRCRTGTSPEGGGAHSRGEWGIGAERQGSPGNECGVDGGDGVAVQIRVGQVSDRAF